MAAIRLPGIAGHRHVNVVKALASDDATKPERGFWQVETSALHDFPQQLRTFDIELNSDYSVSIVTANVDPAVKEGTPAATARKYAVAAMQIVGNPDIKQNNAPLIDPASQTAVGTDPSIHPIPTGSYSAELFVPLSPEMTAKIWDKPTSEKTGQFPNFPTNELGVSFGGYYEQIFGYVWFDRIIGSHINAWWLRWKQRGWSRSDAVRR